MPSSFKHIPADWMVSMFRKGEAQRDIVTLLVLMHTRNTEARIYAPTVNALRKELGCKHGVAKHMMSVIDDNPRWFRREGYYITAASVKSQCRIRHHRSSRSDAELCTKVVMVVDYKRRLNLSGVRDMLEEYIAIRIDEVYSHAHDSKRISATGGLKEGSNAGQKTIPTHCEVRNMPRHIKLANIIGKDRSTASRLIKRLVNQGKLSVHRGSIIEIEDIANGIVLNTGENANRRWGFMTRQGVWKVRIPDWRSVNESPTRVKVFRPGAKADAAESMDNRGRKYLTLNQMANPNRCALTPYD